MVQSVLGGCKLDPKLAAQSNTPPVKRKEKEQARNAGTYAMEVKDN